MNKTYTCEQLSLHFLTTVESFGAVRIGKLMNHFKSAENACKASAQELRELGFTKHCIIQFEEKRKTFDYDKAHASLDAVDVELISITDPRYPFRLREIHGAPQLLYVKGDIAKLSAPHIVSIVGSRCMTPYGSSVIRNFASELIDAGVLIGSGLALGVDAQAHNISIAKKQGGVAVLASGIDDACITPRTNRDVMYTLLECGGCVITEYPPGTHAMPQNFPIRNRIISGMAWGVLVIEAKEKSGSLITAYSAMEQGREVFAVPGSIYSEISKGCHKLIKEGAHLTTTARDIISLLPVDQSTGKSLQSTILFSPQEEMIYNCIKNNPCTNDEIVSQVNLPAHAVLSRLTLLEMKGVVQCEEDGKWYVS